MIKTAPIMPETIKSSDHLKRRIQTEHIEVVVEQSLDGREKVMEILRYPDKYSM